MFDSLLSFQHRLDTSGVLWWRFFRKNWIRKKLDTITLCPKLESFLSRIAARYSYKMSLVSILQRGGLSMVEHDGGEHEVRLVLS
jgi:hypothetical protein